MTHATISLGSHFFVITGADDRMRQATREFSMRMRLAAKTFKNKRGQVVKSGEDKFFAFATLARNEVRYHINYLEDFKKVLYNHRLDGPGMIEWKTLPGFPAAKIDLPIQERFVPTELQVGAIDYILNPDRANSKAVIIQAGGGKSQPLTALIKSPGGWIKMGDIRVGDIITAWDGTPTQVTGIYPQGVLPSYRVTFDDGRSTEVSGDHLWAVDNPLDPVMTTLAIQTLLESGQPLCVPLIRPEIVPDAQLPANPYTFGKRLTQSKHQYSVFIPGVYLLEASILQRQRLLEGLLEGVEEVDARTVYTVYSAEMARDVQYLVRSLGGAATIDVDGSGGYSLTIWLPVNGGKLGIRSVERMGEAQMQCISIDHPDKLYVTDDFIVTHNTLTAMMAASQQGERMAIFVEPEFMPQWVKAFKENCHIEDKRIVTINGGQQLKSLLWMVQDGELPYYAIIVSTTTFREYIKAWKRTGDAKTLEEEEGFAVPPQQFFEHLGVGLRIIDEAHKSFHQVFTLDLFTHVHNSVALSATLFASDAFVTEQMKAAYPPHLRYDKGGFNKYVHAYSLHYSLREPHRIKCMGNMGYNHIEFEKSILKSRRMTHAYFQMVRENMRFTYEAHYQAGDRCLVYFASIDMCTRFTEYLQEELPHLAVKRYVEDDPFENLMTADVSVSTLRSAGTGKDIAQLTTVIMTPAVNSSPINIQGFGRLRDLNRNNPSLGRKMFFVYFCCDDIAKHSEYHQNKKELLKTRALHYEPRFFGTMF